MLCINLLGRYSNLLNYFHYCTIHILSQRYNYFTSYILLVITFYIVNIGTPYTISLLIYSSYSNSFPEFAIPAALRTELVPQWDCWVLASGLLTEADPTSKVKTTTCVTFNVSNPNQRLLKIISSFPFQVI